MADVQLKDFTPKTAPVGADELYGGDSANNFNEFRTTISQIIANNAIPTFDGTIISSTLSVWDSESTMTSSPISVDHLGNLTGVGTLNSIVLSTILISTNNLSDLNNVETARTNLGLGTAAIKNSSSNQTTVAAILGTTTSNHIATFSDTFGTIQDGGALSQFLVSANNLDDVESVNTSFNNISPLTTKGDLITFNGTNNIRHAIGTDGYVLTADSTQPDGTNWLPSPSSAAFVDNAVFASENGTSQVGATPVSVPLDTVIESTSGNTWITNGDGIGMKCQQAGGYDFTAIIPAMHVGATAGYVFFTFCKNGTPIGPNIPYFITGVAAVIPLTLKSFIACISGDVITIQANAPIQPGYSVASASTTGAEYATVVTIVRIS